MSLYSPKKEMETLSRNNDAGLLSHHKRHLGRPNNNNIENNRVFKMSSV